MKTNSRLTLALLLGACSSLALFSGCATTSAPTVVSHADPSVSYANYQTFSVVRPSAMSTARNSVVTPMLARQMRDETAAAFAAKGLTKASDDYSADLLIVTHGGIDEKIDISDWGLSYGRFGRGGLGGRYDITQYKQGTLLVDVFDAKTKELVWRGSAVAEVDGGPNAEKVKAAVDAVVARYPN